jgi:hypothetical protein
MKYKLILLSAAILLSGVSVAQVTLESNAPNGSNYVGFDATSMDPLPIENRGFDEIDISSNLRSKIAITELPTWNGLNGLSLSNVQRTTMGLIGEDDEAWSILHLMSNSPNLLRHLCVEIG